MERSTTMDVDAIGRVFREESGRSLATLVRHFGDLDLAEECVQEAFVAALDRWPHEGLPPNPGGWITTTARNRAIDRLRREATRHDRQVQATAMLEPADPMDVGDLPDDRLRLIFTCCHPALAAPARVALTLRMVAGLQTDEIARAFLVPESTMAQRLVRAKRKIKAAGIPYRVPEAPELPDRLGSVLAVLYLVFTEGHRSGSGEGLVRADLCEEAIRLARLVVALMPDEAEAVGLLALLLLTDARRPARIDDAGDLVLLADQDRTLWDRERIAEGHELVRWCLARRRPGAYQVQAAIAAVHADAERSSDTDWSQVVALYDQLLSINPSPVVRLNRAVAVAEVDGPGPALADVDADPLDGYLPFHATRADLLRRLDRADEAAEEYRRAEALSADEAERRFLRDRRASLG